MEQYRKVCWLRRIIILTVIILQFISIGIYLYDKLKNNGDLNFYSISLTILFFVLMDYFLLYKNIRNISSKTLVERYDIAQYQQKLQKKYDQDMEKYAQESQRIKNDLLTQIEVMRKNLESQNEELDQSVTEFMNILDKTRYDYFCKNMVVNLILTDKKKKAEEQQIEFNAAIDIPEKISINNVDISSMLGNLLDNAIEACSKIPDPEKRRIDIKAMIIDECLVIKATNTFNKSVINAQKKFLITTKKDRKNHGFGINIIRNLAGKYNGELQIHIESDCFIAIVFMDCSEEGEVINDYC